MKRVKRNLTFVNMVERKIDRIEYDVPAYLFTAETKDGEQADLFVYKYEGKWMVNDEVTGVRINLREFRTRKEAVQDAKAVIGRNTLEQLNDVRAQALERMDEIVKNTKLTEAI